MNFSIAWQKINQMSCEFMALLPNLLIGLVMFVGFLFAAKGVQRLVERLVANRHQSQSCLGPPAHHGSHAQVGWQGRGPKSRAEIQQEQLAAAAMPPQPTT